GGCIHTALELKGETAHGKKSYFAKLNDAEKKAMFAAEAEGLAAIRKAGTVRAPAVVAQGDDGEHSWLVLEWLTLGPLDANSAARLGEALAAQHRAAQEKFGWARDNFIGATPQPNGWSDDWLAFWREKRLHAQLRYAARNRLPSKMIDRGERLLADCEAFFRDYRPAKSLLHGDLWGGNAAALADGTPVVFDPAVYVGDREADLAMTELFGGFPREFRAAYAAAWPLDTGYGVRREFYNLYHVLNHANLFGAGYVRQAEQTIAKLLAEIR
ncbi:MAG: fructosamine kinase family protein, partial [Bacillota bacterium]